ncbi:hypothetical protein [Rodentibacter caecimuris]|uniref:Uncharacterized protein n=1 Tax=Rodentibacter caecimuris TaxID=1796644 RepID=A0A9X8W0L3_9PAST|nr:MULTISPECIES: hypothetical protein [Pasteurellaceae]AOF54416.1 hypothetical protein AC062_2330 [Pasteurellaceae bacterium NI1060]MCQ9122767.1 hypothetical protein [Rodentibacter heylii]OOF73035.1 hypothetical protein BKG90_02315 [Rodentibacter heylii]OOF75688.1 hypothetical protein BKG99_07685 [Rodentibacter heylii]QIA76196.1 hypothetical protein FEE42_01920 [Rodentibacter heylii]
MHNKKCGQNRPHFVNLLLTLSPNLLILILQLNDLNLNLIHLSKSVTNLLFLFPSIRSGDGNITPSFIMRKVEYRLNSKVQKGILEDMSEPYIFSADTAEELQGSVEVWYKGEQIQ